MSSTSIPTYIINLEKRAERRQFAENQFCKHPEFNVNFFKAIQDSNPAFGLYKSLRTIIESARKKRFPLVLICEDDHKFSNEYQFDVLKSYLERVEKYEADVFAGGVSWFNCALPAEEDLYWIDNFTGAQFLIIYERFYQKILNSRFTEVDIIDQWISKLSDKIFVAVPMLSVQHDFGYSDVTPKNNVEGRVDVLFSDTRKRWETLKDVIAHTKRAITIYSPVDVEQDMQLSTYVLNTDHHTDRLASIQQQFDYRQEFDISVIRIENRKSEVFELWNALQHIVEIASEQEEDVILICQDDHVFCDAYNKLALFESIYQGAFLGADIILGSTAVTQQIIPVSNHLSWTSVFQDSSFIVIYSSLFQTILDSTFDDNDSVDKKLSSLTANKYIIYPFVSGRKEFACSETKNDALSIKQNSPNYGLSERKILEVMKMFNRLTIKNNKDTTDLTVIN
ncbi:hypothetical protein M8998_01485 [Sphingobacterium sp. lm-10]|uniref:glycosyltransferase family 25 protein n=1 Tax=Sphingobacterium sp. lm-10 TaxID=2944904 RepID=UPI002020FA90|nr:glycosyltransferase family 25 protein [Sphingobacterium sp. lm-10]MCL7986602.1 hypothetical protein [Sphingobacterium sp. lm-10]